MGYAQVKAMGLVGLEGHVVTVEAHVAAGLPGLALSGLPDASLHEARDRVRAAIVNSGEPWPQTRITVNLLPADLPKRGSGFDLAIALVLLAATGQLVPPPAPPAGPAAPLPDVPTPAAAPSAGVVVAARLRRLVLIGELGLDGQIRAVRGVLPMVLAAARRGIRRLIVPAANAAEAGLVPGVTVRSASTLTQVLDYARAGIALPTPARVEKPEEPAAFDLADVVGQERGRFALELAAAGGHHLSFVGPPGAGKTMLAHRLPSILPPLSDEGALEVTAIHSLAGALAAPRLMRRPPFQAPHHSASAPALVGGGGGLAGPGALSLAHRGVLFLDEAPEFGPTVLNTLRQPLEDGWVTLARAGGTTRYPARVLLVLAANPCPCGAPADSACTCSSIIRRRYLGRLSGPLMDRVDLQVQLVPVTATDLLGTTAPVETSAEVLARVLAARAVAAARWAGHGFETNAQAPGRLLRTEPFRLASAVTGKLTKYLNNGTLSARGFDRVLRVAWTIADLEGRATPTEAEVGEAFELRTGGKP